MTTNAISGLDINGISGIDPATLTQNKTEQGRIRSLLQILAGQAEKENKDLSVEDIFAMRLEASMNFLRELYEIDPALRPEYSKN